MIIFIGRYSTSKILSGPQRVAKELYQKVFQIKQNVVFLEYFFSEYPNSSFFNKLLGFYNHKEVLVFRMGIVRMIYYLIINKPTVVQIVTLERFLIFILVLKKILRFKLIYLCHGILRYEEKQKIKHFDSFLEKRLILNSDKIVLLSYQQEKIFDQYYKIDNKKKCFIPNGVSSEFLSVARTFSKDKFRIAIYNNNNSYTTDDNKVLYNILSDVSLKQEFILIIYGSKLELKGKGKLSVVNLGKIDSVRLSESLNNIDFYINNNSYESFSLFTLECMAKGIIVLVSDHAGVSSYIENKIDGFVFKYGSDELNNYLVEIIEGKYDLNKISNSAMHIKSKLDWSVIATKYLDLYKELAY